MDNGFWKSKEMVIGSIIALAIIGIGFGVSATDTIFEERHDCTVPAPLGPAVNGELSDPGPSSAGTGATRTAVQRYAVNENETISIAACTSAGNILIRPSTGSELQITATLRLSGVTVKALEPDVTEFQAVRDSRGLRVAFSHDELPHYRGFFESRNAHLNLEILVPASAGQLNAELLSGVGDITVSNLELVDLTADTAVGDIELNRVAVTGHLEAFTSTGNLAMDLVETGPVVDLHTSVGDIQVKLQLAGTGSWDVHTSVGSIMMEAPRTGAGYALDFSTSVGEIVADIGATEYKDASQSGPSSELGARTSDFAQQAAQISMQGQTSVGDITIETK